MAWRRRSSRGYSPWVAADAFADATTEAPYPEEDTACPQRQVGSRSDDGRTGLGSDRRRRHLRRGGLRASAVPRGELPSALRDAASEWAELLASHPSVTLRARPSAGWSPLEYAAHVRDVLAKFSAGRVEVALLDDDPVFGWWDHEGAAVRPAVQRLTSGVGGESTQRKCSSAGGSCRSSSRCCADAYRDTPAWRVLHGRGTGPVRASRSSTPLGRRTEPCNEVTAAGQATPPPVRRRRACCPDDGTRPVGSSAGWVPAAGHRVGARGELVGISLLGGRAVRA